MHTYTVTIKFDTDRELTSIELENLENDFITQVMEPADQEGEDAEYRTYHQVISTVEREGVWYSGTTIKEGESE